MVRNTKFIGIGVEILAGVAIMINWYLAAIVATVGVAFIVWGFNLQNKCRFLILAISAILSLGIAFYVSNNEGWQIRTLEQKQNSYLPTRAQETQIVRILQEVQSSKQKARYMGEEFPPIFYVTCLDNPECVEEWSYLFKISGWHPAQWINPIGKDVIKRNIGTKNAKKVVGDVLPITRYKPGIEIHTNKNSSVELIGMIERAFAVIGLEPEINSNYVESKIGTNHFIISIGPKKDAR